MTSLGVGKVSVAQERNAIYWFSCLVCLVLLDVFCVFWVGVPTPPVATGAFR